MTRTNRFRRLRVGPLSRDAQADYYIKLYVKKVTQESVVQHSGYECHLAALDCFIPDYEYITESPIERAPKNGPHWGPD